MSLVEITVFLTANSRLDGQMPPPHSLEKRPLNGFRALAAICKHGMRLSKRESCYLLLSGLYELGVWGCWVAPATCDLQVVGSHPSVDAQPCWGAGSCSQELMGDS